jgi:hypothetical protein
MLALELPAAVYADAVRLMTIADAFVPSSRSRDAAKSSDIE